MPLTPLSFLARAAHVYPKRTACIHGERRTTYAELYGRARRLASALRMRGIGVGDTVAVMAPNVPALLEAHYGVPMAGAVLNALNFRLDAATIAFILEHGEARVLLVDREFAPTVKQALGQAKTSPIVVDIDDPLYDGAGERLGEIEYEEFLAGGDPDFAWSGPADEWQAISLNYTSGTTGSPKGVVYHHRGAYLNAIGNILAWGMGDAPVYLWTLPMFHCNGWCFTWAVSAVAGAHVCLRKVEAGAVFEAIERHGVTHFCGAPVVLNMLINAPEEDKRSLGRRIEAATGGAAPPAAVIARMEAMGFRVTHLYGLTESYGPSTLCAWQEAWDGLSQDGQAAMAARQGVGYPTLEQQMVADPETLAPRPADGETIGELMLRSNTLMKGYLKNPEATAEAFAGGWFHTGDLGVMHEDGYVEIKDRSKDIIISGGETISTIEIEGALYRHPAVLEAAVVARPDDHWGETPCAFVDLKNDADTVDEADIIAFCRDHLAHYKAPKTVVFGPLPKTSTGKIQKYVLRERARAL
ncbi:MAG: acyl-CoA synthetase [Alphaproteobacteria bacterium]